MLLTLNYAHVLLLIMVSSFSVKANCPYIFTINNIIDNRLTTGVVTVHYTLSYTTGGTITPAVTLPGASYSATLSPIFFTTVSGQTYQGVIDISVDNSVITDAFSFSIYELNYGECGQAFGNLTEVCEDCIGSFAPLQGKKYVLSAWVREDQPNIINTTVPQQVETYLGPEIELNFNTASSGLVAYSGYKAKGNIIDGWQKVEEFFIIPSDAYDIKIKLKSTGDSAVYFDDIRIHPFNSSMKNK